MKTLAQCAKEDAEITKHVWRNYKESDKHAENKRKQERSADNFRAEGRLNDIWKREGRGNWSKLKGNKI